MAGPASDWSSRIGNRLKLRDVRILFAVVKFGSMAQAARHLGISQPAVSEAVAALEDALQVRLLDRSPRGIAPTIYAHVLLKRGAVVFDELQAALSDIEFIADPGVGEVRLGCPESLMAGFVPAVIAQLSRHHPKITVQVMAAQPGEQQFHELRDRSVDILLGRIFKPLLIDEVEAEVLGRDTFFVVAGQQSRWARLRKVALADLMDEGWILFPPGSLANSHIERGFRKRGLELPARSVTTFSIHTRLELLSTGRFLTVLHGTVLRFNARRWGLKTLPVDLPIEPMPIAIFRLKNRTLSPVVQAFIDHAHKIAAKFR